MRAMIEKIAGQSAEADDYQYYQSALRDSSYDPVIILDENFTITGWSRGAERLYGWTADEVIGRHARDVIQLDSLVFANFLENWPWREDRTVRVKCVHVSKDGSEILVEVLLTLLSESDGYIAVIWDGTNETH